MFISLMHTKIYSIFFFFNDTATTEIYTLSLHDALPICRAGHAARAAPPSRPFPGVGGGLRRLGRAVRRQQRARRLRDHEARRRPLPPRGGPRAARRRDLPHGRARDARRARGA